MTIGCVMALLAASPATAEAAGIDECGGFMGSPRMMCEMKLGDDCVAACSEVRSLQACASKAYPTCEEQCAAPVPAECGAECRAACPQLCLDGYYTASCGEHCLDDCQASCSSRCETAADPLLCSVACSTTCFGGCDDACLPCYLTPAARTAALPAVRDPVARRPRQTVRSPARPRRLPLASTA